MKEKKNKMLLLNQSRIENQKENKKKHQEYIQRKQQYIADS